MPHLRKFLPGLRLVGAILFSGVLSLFSFQASATTCTNTTDGALNDPTVYGSYQGAIQNPDCGIDLSFDYTIAPGTVVSWDGAGGVLSGAMLIQGTLNLQAPAEFSDSLENEGTLNLSSSDSSAEVNFQEGWINRGAVAADSVKLHWQGTTVLDSGTVGLDAVNLKISGKIQKNGGILTVSSSELELSGRTEWMVPESLTFSRLSLNGNNLLLGFAETALEFNESVSLNDSADQIILGLGSLKLEGGLQLKHGYLSISGGSLELNGTSVVESDGALDLADGELTLQSPLTVQGTLRMNSGTVLQTENMLHFDGGVLESSGSLVLDKFNFQGQSNLRLLADSQISSNTPINLETVDLGQNHLQLLSETTDLTVENLVVDADGENGLDTGDADLTVSVSLEVNSGRLASSGGSLTFSGTVSFDPTKTVLDLDNSSLFLSNPLNLSSVLRIGGGSVLPNNGLNLSDASIELDGNLDLAGIQTDNRTFIELKGDSRISTSEAVMVGRLMPHGYTLELGSNETQLKFLGIGDPLELPETEANPGVNLSPVIESLNAERLPDGSLKWRAVISDDSDFSSLTTHWGYLFGATRDFSSPVYFASSDEHEGTVEVVMTNYDDSDGGMLLLTVCEQAFNHVGSCDPQKEDATLMSFELIPYAYQLPLICEDEGCSETLDGSPASLSASLTVSQESPPEDDQSSVSESGSIRLNGGTLEIQEKILLSGDQIETGGGRLILKNGALLNQGASLKLDNGTLELGNELELVGSTLISDSAVLHLLGHVSLNIPDNLSFHEIQLNQKALTLQPSITSLTLTQELVLDHAESGIMRNQASLILNGGVKIKNGGSLELDDPSQFHVQNILLDGGHLQVKGSTDVSYSQNTGISVLSPSTLSLDPDLNLYLENLSLSSDLQLSFGAETSGFKVNRLVLDATAKLSGNDTSKLVVSFPDFTKNNTDLLQLENITVEAEQCLNSETQQRIILLDGGFLEIGNVQEITGKQELIGEILCPVTLNQAKICINENVIIRSDLILNGDAEIYIAPQKTLSYAGTGAVSLQGKKLSILGGGNFVSDQQFSNGISLDDNTSRLRVGGSGTSVSHVRIQDSSGLAVLEALKNWNDECDQGQADTSGSGFIENLEHHGSFKIELEDESSLVLNQNLEVLDNQTISVDGSGIGTLVLGDNLSLSGSLLFDGKTLLSGGTLKISEGVLHVNEDSSIDSDIFLQDEGGTITLDAQKTLTLKTSLEIEVGQKLVLQGGSSANLEFANSGGLINQGILELDSDNLTLLGGSQTFQKGSQLSVKKSSFFTDASLALNETSILIHENAALNLDNTSVDLTQSTWEIQTNAVVQSDNSTLKWEGQLSKSGKGKLHLDEVRLNGNASYLGNNELQLRLLGLDNHSLNLNSESSSLRITDALIITDNQSILQTKNADLVLENGLEFSAGIVSSTAGKVEVHQILSSTGGTLDLSDSTLALEGTWNHQGGAFLSTGNTLNLLGGLSLQSQSQLTFQQLDLEGSVLTFAGATTKLEIQSGLTLVGETEGVQVNSGSLTLLETLELNAGSLSAEGGGIRLEQGAALMGGSFEVLNSSLKLGGQVIKSTGSVLLSGTTLELLSDVSLTSDSLLSIHSLQLGQSVLTLGSAESDLELQTQLQLDDSEEGLITGAADLVLNQGGSMSEGEISSSAGTISTNGSFDLNGGAITLSSGVLALGGVFNKNGGSLLLDNASLSLLANLQWSSGSEQVISSLELNDFALTLGNESSDLRIINPITLDHANEKLISGMADLEFSGLLSISEGELTSSGGEIRFNQGLNLSGGLVEILDSVLLFGSETGSEVSLTQTGGSFQTGSSALQLLQNLTLQSGSGFTFQSLELNSKSLILASETSDLFLEQTLLIDEVSEQIEAGLADLMLKGGIQMSTGSITSTGGIFGLSVSDQNLFQEDAEVILVNTNLESVDSEQGLATLTLNGEPNLSMNGGSIASINLLLTESTIGTVSTRGDVSCSASCSGFDETGSYGLNIHGLYRNVVSSNWKLSEADGDRKNAQISIKLLSRPEDQVSVNFSSSDISEVTMDSYLLTFDESNWNRMQTIILTGEDDLLVDGDIKVRVIGYSNSEDSEYKTVGDVKKHAFKYIFTNINDDIQVGLSPIAKIGPDQMINEGTRVILDGSASYDPDPTGWVSNYTWTQSTTGDLTLQGANQSIANFIAPQIDADSMGLVFQLAVEDNDGTVGYGTTSITIMDTVTLKLVDIEGAVEPVLPKNLDFESSKNADGSASISVAAPSGGFNKTELRTDGSAINRIELSDGTLTQMNVPPGVSFNLNRDASTSVQMSLSGDATLYSQVSATGEMSLGVSSAGKGVNVKAPIGAELQIGSDGTSSIASPPVTNEDGSVTNITTQLNPDGSLQIDLGSSVTSRTANAKSAASSTLTSDPGLALSVDTSNGINVSTKVGDGTLSSTIANTGTSSTTFIGTSATSSFSAAVPMNVKVRTGGTIQSISSGKSGYDGVSRILTSSVGSSGVTVELQGAGEQASTVIGSEGATVAYSENGFAQSSFQNGNSHTSTASINSDGVIDTHITKVSNNSKLILPSVSKGAMVRQEAGKISINVPLGNYRSGRNGARTSSRGVHAESRFSNRSGVYSQYSVSGLWVGKDSASGKPVYVEPLGSDAELLIENSYDNNSSISLVTGSARVRVGDTYQQTLSSRTANASGNSLSVSSVPAEVSLNGQRNLISMPAYLTIQPSDFEVRFGSYKTVWIYRDKTWYFYTTDSSLKTGYLSKGYKELNESIEPGEGFWIELNPPANPSTFEMEFRGSYRMLPQFSFTSEEWSLAGAAETISVEDITKAANFDQSGEDGGNTLGFIDFGNGNQPPGLIGMLNPEVPSLRKTLFILGFATLLWYFSLYGWRASSRNSGIRKRMFEAILVSGLLFGLAACAPPQSDSSMNTVPYSGSKDRLHSIWKWDSSNSKWMAYSPKTSVAEEISNQGYSTFSSVQPGEGFWVRISKTNAPESMGFNEPPSF